MARTAMINARTERELKDEVEGILQSLGIGTEARGSSPDWQFQRPPRMPYRTGLAFNLTARRKYDHL